MASLSLQLKRPNAEKSSIVCQLRDGRGVKLKIASGLSVKPKHWSTNKGFVLSADPQATAKNKALASFKQKVLDIYLDTKSNGIIADATYIKKHLKPKEKANPVNKVFWNVWKYYLQDRRSHFKARSFDKFKYLKAHLEKFEEATKIPWMLDTVNKDRLEKLQTYFYDNDIGTQTTAKYIGVFKMFLNWTFENKYTSNIDFKTFKPIQQKDTLKVILTSEEVEKIRQVDLEGKNYLKNVRELLILSTLTGLRYSDYSRVAKEHFKRDEDNSHILQIRLEKTVDIIEIPLTNEAVGIVQRLIEGEIHPISNQNMNKYAKELCKLAMVDEPFEVHRFKGKLTFTTTKRKHELITTHTGRRTFATNLLLKGVPAETVMLFTGHKDYKSFAKYVNIPKKAKMDMVKNALIQMSVG